MVMSFSMRAPKTRASMGLSTGFTPQIITAASNRRCVSRGAPRIVGSAGLQPRQWFFNPPQCFLHLILIRGAGNRIVHIIIDSVPKSEQQYPPTTCLPDGTLSPTRRAYMARAHAEPAWPPGRKWCHRRGPVLLGSGRGAVGPEEIFPGVCSRIASCSEFGTAKAIPFACSSTVLPLLAVSVVAKLSVRRLP